jgi:ABC-type multidrug transport system permease subunit
MTTYDKKRLAAAFLLLLVVAASANWYFNFLFPRFARFMVAVSALTVAVYATRFAPTRKDFEEHRRNHTGGGS